MKRILKIIVVFFTLAIFLSLESSTLQAQPVVPLGYIQNIKTETVVLASNNIFNGEITASEEENGQNFSSSSPWILTYIANTNTLLKNKTSLKRSFIHNLSTNNKKVHSIRAP